MAGEIIAGPHVRAACARHLRDLEEGPARGIGWDLAAAQEAIAFFAEVLRLNGGQFEGRRFVLNGWQAFVVGSLFGWRITASDVPDQVGARRFRIAYIETGKGSGKSPLAAGVGLKLTCADNEPRAETYAAAYSQEQARVAFRDAVAMVQQSALLSRRLELSGGADPDNIAHVASVSFFRPISSERRGRGKSGPRPHGVLLDEIHEHPTNAMVEFMAAGVKWRRQPLIVMITNSGSNKESVCWEYHRYGIEVCDGTKQNDALFAYICALDKDDDPFDDEQCWVKANPSLPEIPGYSYIRNEVAASRGLPSKENLCRRLNFCEWTDATDAWIGKDEWQKVQHRLNLDDYEGRECFGGLDLSISSDLTAFLLAFPTGPRRWDVFSWFWMPGGRLRELEARDVMAPYYSTWRDDERKYLLALDGKTIDYESVALHIAKICARFAVKAIAYDRAHIELLLRECEKAGIELPLIEHGQGFYKAASTGLWMPGSIAEVEAAITDERIRIDENPVLSWCVSSAVCQASTIRPADRFLKKGHPKARIDGAVALAMAVGAATASLDAGPSVYETRGILELVI